MPLTIDHSWVSEMQQNGMLAKEDVLSAVGKNIITRALGVRENVEIDYRLIKVKPGDVFILCSDGLCGYAEDAEIFAVADKVRGNIDHIVEELIQLANDRGGSDNVTVIAIEVLQVTRSQTAEMDIVTLPAEGPELVKTEDEWLAKIEAAKAEMTAHNAKSKPGNLSIKLRLSLVFAVFVFLAGLLIYFSAGK